MARSLRYDGLDSNGPRLAVRALTHCTRVAYAPPLLTICNELVPTVYGKSRFSNWFTEKASYT